jgi:hypothetical protein
MNFNKGSKINKFVLYVILLFAVVELLINTFLFFSIKNSPKIDNFVPYVGYLELNKESTDYFNKIDNYYEQASQVWLFGGTFLNQTDTRGKTISDQLAASIHQKEKKLHIKDFSQPGYCFDQQRVLFMELLRNRATPKTVVFYTGLAECFSPVIGYPEHFFEISSLIDNKDSGFLIRRRLKKKRIKSIYLLEALLNFRKQRFFNVLGYPELNKDNEERIESILENYIYNMRIIESVCQIYKIKSVFVWQPQDHIYQGKNKMIKKIADNEKILEIYLGLNEMVREDHYLQKKANFLDISQLFNKADHLDVNDIKIIINEIGIL